MMLLIIS